MIRRLFVCAGLALLVSAAWHAEDARAEGKWVLTAVEDSSGYDEVATLLQDAANTIKDEYATKDVTPRLMLQCVPGTTDITARIDWQRFISSFNTEIGFKVDGGKTLWQKWGVDRSNKITQSPSPAVTAALIEALQNGTMLQVEISPYSEAPVFVEYSLDGLASGLEGLAKECS